MNTCPGPERLLALALADPSDDRGGREHLLRCPSCSAACHKIAREHELIVRSLEATARFVMDAPRRRAISPIPMPARRKRPASMTRIGAAGAAAMAAALMLMLAGLHPAATVTRSQSSAANGAQSAITSAPGISPQGTAAAALAYAAPWQSSDVIFTDSTDDIGYHEAIAGKSNYEDLFYCDQQEDGTFCSASAGQG